MLAQRTEAVAFYCNKSERSTFYRTISRPYWQKLLQGGAPLARTTHRDMSWMCSYELALVIIGSIFKF